jgi:hypothetical protein
MSLPVDYYLGTNYLSLNERISARRDAEFLPGDKKFSTKNEMGEINTDWRRAKTVNEPIDINSLGADGLAMLYNIY